MTEIPETAGKPVRRHADPGRANAPGSSPRIGTSHRHLLRNGLFNSGGWAINAAVALLLMPFLAGRLGMEVYGTYILLVNFIGYYIFIDMGLGQGVIKYVAELNARKDYAALNRSLNAALWVQLLLGILGAAALTVFAVPLLKLLNVPAAIFSDAAFCLRLCAVAFFFTMLSATFAAALMGLQRYDLTTKVTVISNLLMTAGIVWALYRGGGLKPAIIITAVFAMINCAVFAMLVKKKVPQFQFFSHFDLATFRELFAFSGYLFISRICSVFGNYLTAFIISIMLGPALVPVFVIPWRLINAAGNFLSSALVVMFPYVSEIAALGDEENVRSVFQQVSQVAAAISIPINLTLAAFSRFILAAWMGKAFAEQAAVVLTLLAWMALLGSLTTVPNLVTMGLGHARLIGIFSIFSLGFYLLFIPLFTHYFGINGTAGAMLVGTLPGLFLLGFIVRKIIRLPLWQYSKNVAGFHALPGAMAVVYFAALGKWLPGEKIWLFAIPFLFLAGYFSLILFKRRLPVAAFVALLKRHE